MVKALLVVKSDSDENMIAFERVSDFYEDVAVSEVTVIAYRGGVQIAGAAGKKVVILTFWVGVEHSSTSDNA